MSWERLLASATAAVLGACLAQHAAAGDIRISIPKRSRLTPVQRLNREGVEAVNKHQYEKAKNLFYKAYLFDPGDPFTLNNLGYVAELEGQAERAHRFYELATMQATDALIDRASSSKLEGESLQSAITAIRDLPMQVNRANVNAVRLLSQGRVREADAILLQALTLDPRDPFTLNNMGVAKEAEGEYAEALHYYDRAASAGVEDPVVVTMNAAWKGRPISQMARESADHLRSRMKTLQTNEATVALLNLRGVSALNRNDWSGAWKDFSEAFSLAPGNAFSLNNQGYMAEMNGDLETAQEFYREARTAGKSGEPVGLATRAGAEGASLFTVANESENQVSGAIESAGALKRRKQGPIRLQRRDGRPLPPSPEALSSHPQ